MSATETAKGTTGTNEPSAALKRQGRRAAEAKATVPATSCTIVLDRPVAAPGTLIAALASSLREHPEANASYRDAEIERHSRVNAGVLVPDGDGTALVTIFDADTKEASAIDAELAVLAARVASGEITSPETSGATCSVTDLSGSGLASATAVLVPPHAIALAAAGGSLTLTYDLRLLSPFTAATFLGAVARHAGPST
ncbi:MAG: 2-oxo acid dehydrogenase subunit E2 [Baekduia sp.]